MEAELTQTGLKKLKTLFPTRAPHIDMFEAIRKAIHSVSFKHPPVIERDKLKRELRSGRTILDACGRKLDVGAFGEALRKLFAFLADHASKGDKNKAASYSAIAQDRLPDTLMDDYLLAAGEALTRHAKNLGLTVAELISCCQQAIRPQLIALRDANLQADDETWILGHCPCCGALPCTAELTAEGVLLLHCPNCLAIYRFARHRCPGCGHAGLVTLTMEAWPHLLLEKCPKCESCLKTWNDGSARPPCPHPYLDLVTGEVDEAAGLQGLKRLSIGVMGI